MVEPWIFDLKGFGNELLPILFLPQHAQLEHEHLAKGQPVLRLLKLILVVREMDLLQGDAQGN